MVSVDQWRHVVLELGGACAKVKTLLASSSVDPHDYEPSPADAATFAGAQMVVVNGAPLRRMGQQARGRIGSEAPRCSTPGHDASESQGKSRRGGQSARLVQPAAVTAVADAVTAELARSLRPEAATTSRDRHDARGPPP